MNRRQFLSLLAATPLAALVPARGKPSHDIVLDRNYPWGLWPACVQDDTIRATFISEGKTYIARTNGIWKLERGKVYHVLLENGTQTYWVEK